ncbi:MAG TPA: EI24 domain-containing protein [Chitinophagaceae bacterium]
MLKDLVVAIQSYFKAHEFIRKHRMWKWILAPGILYCILFIISMYFFAGSVNTFIEWIKNVTGLTSWQEKINSYTVDFLLAFGGLILWLILMLFYFSLFKYIWLIIGSPVFAYLSEKTESIIEGRDFPFSWRQLMIDVGRGIRMAIRNTLWQTVYVVFIAILSLLPVLGWPAPILSLFTECYFYGFSMLDYSMERRRKSVSESVYFINQHKGLAIGNGMVFYLMHLVPVLGWVLAPAYAVVAATLSLQGYKTGTSTTK